MTLELFEDWCRQKLVTPEPATGSARSAKECKPYEITVSLSVDFRNSVLITALGDTTPDLYAFSRWCGDRMSEHREKMDVQKNIGVQMKAEKEASQYATAMRVIGSYRHGLPI